MSAYVGMPPPLNPSVTRTKDFFQALDNFTRVFAIRPGEKVLMLTDPLLDPRVVDAVTGLARSRGAEVRQYMETTSQVLEVAGQVRALLEAADFVVSTWFCSIISPFCIGLRAKGQRWVKITYFRDLDLLYTPQARFPAELVGERRPRDGLAPSAKRLSTFLCGDRGRRSRSATPAKCAQKLLAGNRSRGKVFADEPGCYVHYLPTHGPNLWDRTAHGNDADATGVDARHGLSGGGGRVPASVHRAHRVRVRRRHGGRGARRLRGSALAARNARRRAPDRARAAASIPRRRGSPRLRPGHAPGTLHFGIDLASPRRYIRRGDAAGGRSRRCTSTS